MIENKILNAKDVFDVNTDIQTDITDISKNILQELNNKTDYYKQRFVDDWKAKVVYSQQRVISPFKDYCDDELLTNCEQLSSLDELEALSDAFSEWQDASLDSYESFINWKKALPDLLEHAYESHYTASLNFKNNQSNSNPGKQLDYMTKYIMKVLKT